ncbi:MAG: YbaK/EbsC family protein [Chloroflexota bacterium]
MRFHEVHIETRRERPARAKTEGERYLIRAGYLRAEGGLTDLGDRAASRLRRFAEDAPNFLELLGLSPVKTEDGEVVAHVPAGDFQLLRCRSCGYAASVENAKFRKVPLAHESQQPLERVATPDCSTIDSLARFLGVPQSRTAKVLLYTRLGGDDLIFVVIRGDMQISERKLRAAAGALQPATHDQIIRAGAIPGYASPIGLDNAFVFVLVDDLIPHATNLVGGANEVGYHMKNTNCGRDYRADEVADLTLAHPGDGCTVCGSPLESAAGQLVADQGGIRFPEVLRALAEQHHDDRGLRLPMGASPFDVHLLHLPSRELDTKAAAVEIHRELEAAGMAVLFDDRDERAGVKFNDADLIGCPLRVTVGERHLADRMVELKSRFDASMELVPIEEIVAKVRSLTVMPR